MKRCPECRRDYYDETLLYCLDDGTPLLDGPASGDAPAAAADASTDASDNLPTRAQVDMTSETALLPAGGLPRSSHSSNGPSSKTKWRKTTIVIGLAAVALTAGLAFVIYRYTARKPIPFQSIQIAKLTNIGSINTAQISPNGEYVAHVVFEGGKSSIRVWDVATKSNIEIVPPTEDILNVNSFSADSRYIYFRRNVGGRPGAIYQIAVLGGAPKLILETNNTGITFSPDGRRFASLRTGPGQAENSIVIANTDGTDEQTLVTRSGGERFGTLGPSWSPDGKLLACAVNIDGSNLTVGIVSVADGSVKPITSRKWKAVNRLAWLHDGSGLIFSALDEDVSKIWYISYPAGEVRRITNDVNEYGTGSVSVTADSSTISTLQLERVSNTFIASALDASHGKQITPVGGGRGRGFGFSWTPDGRIAYSTISSGNTNLWIMNADGTGNRQLTNETEGVIGPAVSPDGRYVVFNSARSGRYNLWRIDIDGSHPKQLTDGGDDEAPTYSPDGRWLIYDAISTSDLRKIPIDGGDPVRLTERRVIWPQVSPKDGTIAGIYRADDNSPQQLAFFAPEGGSPVKSFDLPPGTVISPHWTADGRSLIYVITRADSSSLWSQSVDGGPPKQIADFSPEQIFSFDISRDGRSFAFSRGTIIRDVVLITDTREQ